MANVLSIDKKVAVITALVEGCSINSTVRMTGVAKTTILRLLEEVGMACAEAQDALVHNVSAKRVQVDEIWSFCYCKQKNLTGKIAEERIAGDVWTFAAMDADSKLVLSWVVGRRDAGFATDLLSDVAARLSNRVQLTTDGHKMYLEAVPEVFGNDVDFAQLVKVYGNDPEGQKRYSPAQLRASERVRVIGTPDPKFVSTSYIERQNLTTRMQNRRYTRLTNAFSKKIENHQYQVALFYFWYNFCRTHSTLKTTPAVAAVVSSHVWSIQDIVSLSYNSIRQVA